MSNNEKEITVRKLGRPSLYEDRFAQDLLDYFGEYLKSSDSKSKPFPSLAGFAIKIGVHRDTLDEWAKARDENDALIYPEFSDAHSRAKYFQENYLLIHGLEGNIHPQFGMFVAKNILGWRDKQKDEVDTVINNNNLNNNVSESEIDKKIQEKLEKLGMGK